MTISRLHSAVLLGIVLLAGCDRNTTGGKPIPVKKTKIATKPGVAGSAAKGNLTGKVAETMGSGNYTYIKLETGTWVAVPKTKVKVGQTVTIATSMEVKNFKSPTLKRVFASITFGSLGQGGKGMAHGMGKGAHGAVHGMGKGMGKGAMDVSRAHAGLSKKKAALDKPIPKASGADGHTVASLYAGRAGLKDKKVAVRGEVVKVNRGIMGRNWLHLQDGTGTVAGADFDLTVTSKGVADVGKVVLIRGVLRVDKDFGAGYRYAVIVEDAEVVE